MDELRKRIEAIRAELEELNELEEMTDDDEARFAELMVEFDDTNDELTKLEDRQKRLDEVRAAAKKAAFVDPGTDYEPDDATPKRTDVFDLDEVRQAQGEDLVARAVTGVESARQFTDSHKETLIGWLEDDESKETQKLARHVLVTSSPTYRKAWFRAFRAAARGGQDMVAMDTLQRAMSLTDAAGGFAVPQDLDPALILTSDGSTNPFRQASRVVQTLSDQWEATTTTHATWSWDAEAAEVSDDATTFAAVTIPVHKAQVFIPFSIEIGMDYPGFAEDVRNIIVNGKDDLDATAFATGSGSGEPTGIVTALSGTGSEIGSATTDVFAIADVYSVEEALPAKYRARAAWTANKAIYNDIRQFDTAGGAGLWERIGAAQPALLLGYPAYEASAMDGTINATQDNYVAVIGDWSNYVIVDRIGFQLELVPHLFATGANRPSGQRGFYGFARTGADSVNDGGFRLLNVT